VTPVALAWTVEDPAVAGRLIQAGIDGIVTDDPRIFEGPFLT
jgi:glycerophosphoryl diester phosphodiesterase